MSLGYWHTDGALVEHNSVVQRASANMLLCLTDSPARSGNDALMLQHYHAMPDELRQPHMS